MDTGSRQIKRIFMLIFSTLPLLAASQSFERIYPAVEMDGRQLSYPWAGGLNAPQFIPFDFNGDEREDLLMYDRIGSVVIPMINDSEPGGMAYLYAPEYRDAVPPVTGWVTVRDFNGDGLPDYFTSSQAISGVFGIALYQAEQTGSEITYRLRTFDQKQYLVVPAGNGTTNIYVSWEDIPAIEDVDRDGDLDILSFDPGGSYVTFYRNLVTEQGLPADTMVFEVGDHCWGKILESEISEDLFLSSDSLKCSDGNLDGEPVINTRHSGSTILVFDQDNDNDYDILIGDITSTSIVFGRNGGSVFNAWITEQDARWPSYDTPLDNPYFNAAFLADINNDGFEDILCAVNSRSFAEDRDVVWYYAHTGNTDEALFELVRKDLFTGDMIEFGSETAPAFCDINADGLPDLIVGAFRSDESTQARIPSLYLLVNTGQPGVPQFEIADDDYLGLSSYGSLPTWAYAPAVGDLDGDGDDDLVVGEYNGQLFYFENEAGPGEPYDFGEEVFPYAGIDVGSAASPAIYDINKDGLGDLVVGERNTNFGSAGNCGALNYFQNNGTVGEPGFNPDETAFPNTNCFGNVVLGTIPGLPVFSKPAFIETGDGPLLLMGSDDGGVQVYRDILQEVYGSFTLVNADYGMVREGFKTSPAAADLDGNGFHDLVVGNRRGGLSAFSTGFEKLTTSASGMQMSRIDISLFPNPAGSFFSIRVPEGVEVISFAILDGLGALVLDGKMPDSGSIRTGKLAPGLYFVLIETGEGSAVRKLLIQD